MKKFLMILQVITFEEIIQSREKLILDIQFVEIPLRNRFQEY